MRFFIAIELSQEVRSHLAQISDDLKSQISNASFTRPENLHMTLKFLGEVEEKRLPDLKQSLTVVRADRVIEIFAEKLVCFPRRGPVRILAAAFGGSIAGLIALHQAIEQRCQLLNFERENRAYRPHVTLAPARGTPSPEVRKSAAVTTLRHFPGPSFQVNDFVLMRSHLEPGGSRYELIQRFFLDNSP